MLYLLMPGWLLLSHESPAVTSVINAALVVLVGTLLAHKTYEQRPWSSAWPWFHHCRYLFGFVALISILLGLLVYGTALGQGWIELFQRKCRINQYQTGFNTWMLWGACFFVGLLLMSKIRRCEYADWRWFSPFALPVMISTGLTWTEATSQSSQGVQINWNVLAGWWFIVGVLLSTPLASALAVPWIYCVHREIFWGPAPLPERPRAATKARTLSCSP